ncbi:hypothetical protein GCM10027440_16650 [Nocardiopsis coralliicola]
MPGKTRRRRAPREWGIPLSRETDMFRSIRNLLIFIVGGVGMTIGSITTMSSAEVMCGSEAMSPGDICETTRRGNTTTTTYEEEAASDQTGAKVMIVLGPLLAVGGSGYEIWRIRRMRAARNGAQQQPAAPPHGGPPHPQQPHPQQYGAPQPHPQPHGAPQQGGYPPQYPPHPQQYPQQYGGGPQPPHPPQPHQYGGPQPPPRR